MEIESIPTRKYECIIRIGTHKEFFNLPLGEMQVIVDCRSPIEYHQSHVAGAFSFPLDDMMGDILAKLGEAAIEIYPDSYQIVCLYGREGAVQEGCSGLIALAKCIQDNGGLSVPGEGFKRIGEIFILTSYEDFAQHFPFLITRDTTALSDRSALIFFPSQITDWCYLGSSMNAQDKEALRFLGISVIINCTVEVPNFFEEEGLLEYHRFSVIDAEDTDMRLTWETIFPILINCKRKGCKVLVHCAAGKSRSASSIVYAIVRGNKIPLPDALRYVKSCRSIANPNDGFIRQLKEREEEILSEKTNTFLECERFIDDM